jgi:hypothetical protein
MNETNDPREELIKLLKQKGLSACYAARYFPRLSMRELYRLTRREVGAPNPASRAALEAGLRRLRKLPDYPGWQRSKNPELKPEQERSE